MVAVLDNHPKFQFQFKINIKKISYKRRAYESVDDKSLSWTIPQKLWKTEFVTEKV